jgi:Family of unknown function (DUF6350)
VTTTHPQGTRGGAGQGFATGESAAGQQPGTRPGAEPGRDQGSPQRPLALTGAIAACAAAAAGLATLTVVAAIAWIAAVRIGLGAGLAGVLRTAVQLWLAAHHVGFDLHTAGKIGLLPLGLVLVPGAVLWRAGRWVVRRGGVARLRHVGYAALALALPYGLLTGALAVASRTAASAPSPVEAAVAGFLLAFAAGGLGGARALAPWARLIGLLPDRARCLVVGVTGSLAVLAGAGALLTGASLVAHSHEFSLASDVLSPGLLGSALLLLAALAYLPNAIIWAMAYMIGPGFAFGAGTVVAPAGTILGPLPVFPMLAALPAGSAGQHPAPLAWTGLAVLAVPYLAGAFGGLLTVRTAPTPTVEAAPLWGLASGVLTGGVLGALAMFSGGSLGTGRLAATGPVAWQVALVAALELGVAAAITAGLANWLLLRRVSAAAAAAAGPDTADADDAASDMASDDVASDPASDTDPDDIAWYDSAEHDATVDDTSVDDNTADDAVVHRSLWHFVLRVIGLRENVPADAAEEDAASGDAVDATEDAPALRDTAVGDLAVHSSSVHDSAADDAAAADGDPVDAAEDGPGPGAAAVGGNMTTDDAVDDAYVTDDDGAAWVPVLGAVTAEDLASLAGSPGADASMPPVLPAGGAADEFGYLPEPLEIADDPDDAEPVGPPEPVSAPSSAPREERQEPGGSAEDKGNREPENSAEPGDSAADEDSAEDASALGHVIYLRPRDRGGSGTAPDEPESGQPPGHDAGGDREATGDAAHDPRS